MAKKRRKVPAWANSHIAKCKEAFGLWNWAVTVRMVDNLRFGKQPAKGVASRVYRTLEATIELTAGTPETDDSYATITHEMLHVATTEIDNAITRIMHFIPKQHRGHCRDLYEDAQEHTIEHMATYLAPVLRAVQQGKEK